MPAPDHSNPYAAPKDTAAIGSALPAVQTHPRKRGGCLGALLILTMILSPIVALVYVIGHESLTRALHAPAWTVPTLAAISVVHFISAVGAWRFKRWGIYGTCAMSVAALAINATLNVSTGQGMAGLLGPMLLVGFATKQWQDFD